MRRTAAEAAQTRADVLAAARELFATRGYHQVSVPEIAKAAGVTHGALYHHFATKVDLFRAVFQSVEHELNDQVVLAALAEPTTWDAFVAGTWVVLEDMGTSAYQQIALTDAPSVFGWHEWRTIDSSIGLQTLRSGLGLLQAEGFLRDVDLDALAVIVFGALTEGTITLAKAGTDLTAGRLVETLCRLVLALSPGMDPPNDRWRSTQPERDPSALPAVLAGLTARERDLVLLVAAGRSNREIAVELHLSEKTVRNNLSSAFAKLGIRRRTEVAPLVALNLLRPS